MWDLPRPGLEPVSPALAGRFSTTAPPGKLLNNTFVLYNNLIKRKTYFGFNLLYINNSCGDFPGGPVVKNLPSNAGDTGSIPGRGTKIPHAAGS